MEASREATRMMPPVSVFISRKTQRLYVRQSFQPVFESPITIRRCRPSHRHAYLYSARLRERRGRSSLERRLYGQESGKESAWPNWQVATS